MIDNGQGRMDLSRWLLALLLCFVALPAAAADAEGPPVRLSADGRTASMRLDVLTFNIEGVPLRSGRKAQLREIGLRLAALRQAGQAPDVVLFQEAFSGDAKQALRAAAYPAVASGPRRGQDRRLPAAGARADDRWVKGELGAPLVDSGLVVASRFPIVDRAAEPFGRHSCAGFDCLSNKGAVFARIAIPGLPDDLDVFGAHMNAQTASRVPLKRHLSAHQAQSRELADFVSERRSAANPAILAGDFNMRGSASRFAAFEERQPLDLVHRYCVRRDVGCDVQLTFASDAPWLETQDLQLFGSGARVSVRPVRIETLFDGRPDSPKLSDHVALRVIYELSWRVDAAAPPAAAPRSFDIAAAASR